MSHEICPQFFVVIMLFYCDYVAVLVDSDDPFILIVQGYSLALGAIIYLPGASEIIRKDKIDQYQPRTKKNNTVKSLI